MADLRLIDISVLPRYTALFEGEAGYMLVVPNACLVEAPRVDAEPVRHGRWMHDFNNLYSCSKCLGRETMSPKHLKPYCPNCGAKMDGGADDEKNS